MNAVDTNVLIYACDALAAEKHDRAMALVGTMDQGVLLWQVACEFISASRKLSGRGLTSAQAWNRLDEFLAMMPLRVPDRRVLDQARVLHIDHQCSFWDALIYASCLGAGVDRIYSEDLPGAPVEGLEIVNPFAHATHPHADR